MINNIMNIKEKLIKNLISYDKLLPRERESIEGLASGIKTSQINKIFDKNSEEDLKCIANLMIVFYLRGGNDVYKSIKEEKN